MTISVIPLTDTFDQFRQKVNSLISNNNAQLSATALGNLTTSNKGTLVAAINEINTNKSNKFGDTFTGNMTFNQNINANGRILLTNGTASNPSLTFNNDQDSGFYWNSNSLNTVVGGTRIIEVTNGNIKFNRNIELGDSVSYLSIAKGVNVELKGNFLITNNEGKVILNQNGLGENLIKTSNIIDKSITTEKATIATKLQSEKGELDTFFMTPLKTFQQLTYQISKFDKSRFNNEIQLSLEKADSAIQQNQPHKNPTLRVEHRTPSQTGGGSYPNRIPIRRELNTVTENSIEGANLSNNVITLPKGRYIINSFTPFFRTDYGYSWLYNITEDDLVVYGSSDYNSGSSSVCGSWSNILEFEFEISKSCRFALMFRASNTNSSNSNALGIAEGLTSYSVLYHVFTQISIEKVI